MQSSHIIQGIKNLSREVKKETLKNVALEPLIYDADIFSYKYVQIATILIKPSLNPPLNFGYILKRI